jgi:uncharacterized protein YbjQ (UPF0145 family)
MLAVTIESLPGYEIRAVIGEVVGTTARPLNKFVEGVKDLAGGTNPHVVYALNRWREEAVASMLDKARRYGANAVVGMRFDHRPINDQWTELCAYGTAVYVVRILSVAKPRPFLASQSTFGQERAAQAEHDSFE